MPVAGRVRETNPDFVPESFLKTEAFGSCGGIKISVFGV